MQKFIQTTAAIFMMVILSVASIADDKDKKDQKKEKAEMPKSYTIIHAGTLLSIPGKAPQSEQSLIIHKDKIKAIVKGYVTKVDGDDKAKITVIDMTDKFIMPGMIDVHVHMGSRKKDKVEKALETAVHARKTVLAGFTSIREIGLRSWDDLKVHSKIKKGELMGPRITHAGKIIGIGPSGCNGAEECRKKTRENIQKGAEWIKIYASCSGFYTCSEEDYPTTFFDDEIDAIFATAKKYRVPVTAHSHPRASAHYVLDRGVKSIEHGTFLDDKALKRMKKDGVFFVPTLAVQDFLEKSKKSGRFDAEKQTHIDKMMGDTITSRVEKAVKFGVKIAAGSDAGVVPNGKNYREVERLADIKGISNADAIKMATVNSADLLGKLDTLGTLEAGKLADIIAIDGDPIKTIKDIRKVTFVMIGGKIWVNKP